VQSAFFVGYAITQVFGGVLGGRSSGDAGESKGGYRSVLPASLFLSGVTTLLFPLASIHFGHVGASIDRFVLGLFEGLLLPAAMAGVGDTVNTGFKTSGTDENYKATASSLVIAGCYLGSAWAYLSAYVLFSEQFQLLMQSWGFTGEVWPIVFYVNGILSFLLLWAYREEFDLSLPDGMLPKLIKAHTETKLQSSTWSTQKTNTEQNDVWSETFSIAKQCVTSRSGRAILAAQIGQGALLYSIASWGPLYLERIGVESATSMPDIDATQTVSTESISQVAVTASKAAYSLIPSQLTQALVGITIGAAADQLSNQIGTQFTRRSLQLLSGVIPAVILLYLTLHGGEHIDDNALTSSLTSPAFLFGSAQTISALSLGAVSVSHLDIAAPSASGAVYASGNVAAAVSGSGMVHLFGILLERSEKSVEEEIMSGGQEFAIPFQVVAFLSVMGSLVYGLTVETDLEIGVKSNSTITK
jgi:hypothetical protein